MYNAFQILYIYFTIGTLWLKNNGGTGAREAHLILHPHKI